MATTQAHINAADTAKSMTLEVVITRPIGYRIRFSITMLLLKIARFFSPFYCVIITKDP